MLLSEVASFASTQIDTYQDFHTGTQGPLTLSVVTNSAYWGTNGTGTWGIYSVNPDFASYIITNEPALTYPTPVVCGGNTRQNTGTNFIAVKMSTAAVESISLYFPGGSGGSFTSCCISGFFRFGTTNNTGTQVNYDLIETDGNPFGIMQQQTAQWMNRVVAHTPGGTGPNSFTVDPTKWYYVTFFRDDVAGFIRLRFYDSVTFAFLQEISASLIGTNVWWIRFQANYLAIGSNSGGVYEFGGLSVSYGPHANDDVVTPIIASSISLGPGTLTLPNAGSKLILNQ